MITIVPGTTRWFWPNCNCNEATGMGCAGHAAPPPNAEPVPDFSLTPLYSGWICPRCGRVNAPFVSACSCPPNGVLGTTASFAASA